MIISYLPALVAALCLIWACVCDLRRFEIPNRISVLLVLLAVLHAVSNPPFDWLDHTLALFGMLVLGMSLYAAKWMGGGDIKLMLGMSAWTGLSGAPVFLVGMMISGGVLAIIILSLRAFVPAAVGAEVPGALKAGAPLPYALAITAGAYHWAAGALF